MLNRGYFVLLRYDSAYTGRSTPITAFDGFTFILCFHITGTLEICMKKFDAEKIFFLQNGYFVNLDNFSDLYQMSNS